MKQRIEENKKKIEAQEDFVDDENDLRLQAIMETDPEMERLYRKEYLAAEEEHKVFSSEKGKIFNNRLGSNFL
jgi:hypothetical protein